MRSFDVEVMVWVNEETLTVGLTLLYSRDPLYQRAVGGALRSAGFEPQCSSSPSTPLAGEKRDRPEPTSAAVVLVPPTGTYALS